MPWIGWAMRQRDNGWRGKEMNIAILFEAAGNAGIGAGALLAGKELFCYSLKAFYLHPRIDAIVLALPGSERTEQVKRRITGWKTECGIEKPVWIGRGISDLRHIGTGRRGDLETVGKADLYALHDIRYPFVTADMIYGVMEKAALYGCAVTAGKVEEGLFLAAGQEALEEGRLRCVKYPAALRSMDGKFHILEDLDGMLGRCVRHKAYLCDAAQGNPFVCTWEGLEMAESMVRARAAL